MTGTSRVADAPVELVVGGMSCAACAARIEKRLNLLDGVAATVNYATERAYISAAGGRDISELMTAIEAAGYTAALPLEGQARSAAGGAAPGRRGRGGAVTTQRAAEAPAGQAWGPGAGRPRGSGAELIRAGLAPVICAAALIGLLSAWVATGGGGTVSRVTIRVGQAAVTLPSSSAPDQAATFLTITNLGGPDTLLSARSQAASRVVFVRHTGSAAGPGIALGQVAIPAHGTLSLSPFGLDIVLQDPGSLTVGASVPLVLTFRHAGRVTVDATVTPPGTP